MTQSVILRDAQVSELTLLATKEECPIDLLVQEAVDDFLARKRLETQRDFEAGLGLWGDGEDGLAYQERLRTEW